MSKNKQRLIFEALEPRLLYSADPIAVLFDLSASDSPDSLAPSLLDSLQSLPMPQSDARVSTNDNNTGTSAHQQPEHNETASSRQDSSSAASSTLVFDSTDEGTVATDEDSTYIFNTGDYDFTGVTGVDGEYLETITITRLPSAGELALNGSPVTLDQEITYAQIQSGLLQFTPDVNGNGTLYASFDFFVNSGKDSITVLAGEPSSYTLGGGALAATDAIIAHGDNFGPGATVSSNITVIDSSYAIDAAYLSQGDVLFDGFTGDNNWTASELTALDNWVQAGGVLISTSDTANYDPLSAYYGLSIGGWGNSTWHVDDASHSIMDGPFGLVGNNGDSFSAAGSISYFDSSSLVAGDQIIAVDSVSGEPTMLLRQVGSGHILFTSDEGIFRASMSGGGSISTANDMLAANVFAWAADQVDSVNTHAMNIDVNAVNDDPVNLGSLPSDLTVTEDVLAGVDLSALDLSDVDHAGGNLTVTMTTASGGNLSATNGAGIAVTGNASAVLTLSGTQDNLNTYFNTSSNVQYVHGTAHTAGDSADTITVTVNDNGNSGFGGGAEQSLGSINVDITAVNDVPVAADNTVNTQEDEALVITASDFNFTDAEGDALSSVTLNTLNLNGGTLTHSAGTVTVSNGMTVTAAELTDLTFTPALNNSGQSSFRYTVNDAEAGVTSAVMSIMVNAVNDAPVATGNTVVAVEDKPLGIHASDFSFSDAEGDALASVTITGLNLNGGTLSHSAGAVAVSNGMTVTAAELADLTFTSALNQSNNASFTYTVNDADAGVTSALMSISVDAENDLPVATGNTLTTDEDVPLTIRPSDFSFTDVENDALASVTITALHLNGGTLSHSAGAVTVTNGMTVSAAELADLTFVSALNNSTNASFVYTVNDADAGVISATMNITVNAVNDLPVATGNTVVSDEDVPLQIAASEFSFTDAEDDALTSVTITSLDLQGATLSHSSGTVTVTNGMTVTAAELADLTYTSAANDSTDASFSYTVNDADTGTASAVMDITVNAINDAPVATGNNMVATEDVPMLIGASHYLYTDVENDALVSVTFTGLNLGAGTLTHSAGAVTVSNGMTVTAAELADLSFTTAENANQPVSFEYAVNDASAGQQTATMDISVDPVNDVPVATGNSLTTAEDQPLLINASAFLYTDIESDALTSVTLSNLQLNGGSLTHSAGTVNVTNGMQLTAAQLMDLSFQPALNSNLPVSFDYRVNDGDNGVIAATMHIAITPINDSPVIASNGGADNATVQVIENQTQVTTVVATDADSADTLNYSIDGGSDASLFSIDHTTGELSFTSAPNFEAAQDSNQDNVYDIVVTASDGNGGVDQQALSIAVVNENETPTDLVLSHFLIDELTNTNGGFMLGLLSAADEDLTDTLSFAIVGGADAALFSINGADSNTLIIDNGVIRDEQQSAYELVIRATDANGAFVDRTITILVRPRDIDIPEIEGPIIPPMLPNPVEPSVEPLEPTSPFEKLEPFTNYTPTEIPASHHPVDIDLGPVIVDKMMLLVGEMNPQESLSSTSPKAVIPLKQVDLLNINLMPQSTTDQPAVAALSELDDEPLVGALKRMSKDMEDAFEKEEKQQQLIMEIVSGVTLCLTAGFVSWMLQSGSLLASLLSAVPVWKRIDPLLILAAKKRSREEIEEETEEEKRISKVFD